MFEIKDINQPTWERFIATRPEANFLQSWQWGELHQQLGDTVIRQGIFRDQDLIGVLLGIVKDARRGRYLEVPGGPLIDWNDSQLSQFATEQLHQLGRKHKCVFVRVRPQVYEEASFNHQLLELGYKKAPMHLHAEHTNILSLSGSEDDLLTNMRRQTRYEVRRSMKQDLQVSFRTGATAIDEFYRTQVETAKRQGFIPPSQVFLTAQAEAFGDKLRVYRAEKDGQLLNLALVIIYGQEAVYHEAASTLEARKFPGAYGLIWQAIRDAKQAGCQRFNFWGIAYSDDPNHRYAGVTTFKRGFGGDDVTFTPAHDLILSQIRYSKNWLIETIRKKKRKL